MPAGPARIALIERVLPRCQESIAYLSASGEPPKILEALKRNLRFAKLLLRHDEQRADVLAEMAL